MSDRGKKVTVPQQPMDETVEYTLKKIILVRFGLFLPVNEHQGLLSPPNLLSLSLFVFTKEINLAFCKSFTARK
jgi:hypothetical protein